MGERYALKGDWREIWIKRGPLEAGRFWGPSGPHTQMWGTFELRGVVWRLVTRSVFIFYSGINFFIRPLDCEDGISWLT